jgi:hypothetical protein
MMMKGDNRIVKDAFFTTIGIAALFHVHKGRSPSSLNFQRFVLPVLIGYESNTYKKAAFL